MQQLTQVIILLLLFLLFPASPPAGDQAEYQRTTIHVAHLQFSGWLRCAAVQAGVSLLSLNCLSAVSLPSQSPLGSHMG